MPKNVTAIEIIWRSPWVRALTYILLAIFVLFVLFTYGRGAAFAVQVAIVGFVVAYILNPVVGLLGRLRIGRSLAVVIIYIVLLLLAVLGSVLLSQVIVQTGEFVRRVPSAIQNDIAPFIERTAVRVSSWQENLPDVLSNRFGIDPNGNDLGLRIQEQVAAFLERTAVSLNSVLRRVATDGPGVLLTGATSILSTTTQVVLILLTSAYFLYDFPRFTANFRRYVPVRWRPLYNDLIAKADMAVGGYLRGQLLITAILGVFVWVGLRIVGVPLAEAISFLAAIFNLVPYLGPIIGVIPAVILGFTVSPLTALLAVVVFIVANQIEGNILSPFILSKSTNLHPVTVLLAILAGAGLFGLVGALLAVPVVALVKVILEEYLLRRPAYQEANAVVWEDDTPQTAQPSAPRAPKRQSFIPRPFTPRPPAVYPAPPKTAPPEPAPPDPPESAPEAPVNSKKRAGS